MESQPQELRRIAADPGPARTRRSGSPGGGILLVGVGTSWHAAQHGAWLLDGAEAAHAADVAPYERRIDAQDGVIVLSHTAHTGLLDAGARARPRGRRRRRAHLRDRQRRGRRDGRARAVLRVHREPHGRAAAHRADRAGARGGPGDLEGDPGCGRRRPRPARAADRRPPAARRADRRGAECVDRAGGRAEDPRGVLRRRRGTVVRAVLPRAERRARRAGHAGRPGRRRPEADRTEAIAARSRPRARASCASPSAGSASRCRSSR